MRKFVGLVNGKSFDNEEDFNKAAQEAIESNEGNLAISSYYSYVKDEEDMKEEIDDSKYVSTNEYFLGTRKPDKVEKLDSSQIGLFGYTNVEYSVSPELEERLKSAVNKNNIKESINYHVAKLANSIKRNKENLNDIEKKIDTLQNDLFEKQNELMDQEGRRKYYNHLLDIVEAPEEKSEDKKEKEDYIKPGTKNNFKEILSGGVYTGSLLDILKQMGLLK